MVPRLVTRSVAAGVVVLGVETAYAVLRPVPQLEEFDPSGLFGDPQLPPMRVAVLGDSSVTAPGVAGPEEIWVTRVCARLGATHHVALRSFAVSGSKAADLIDDQLDPAIAFLPDLFLVAVGANDALRGVRLRDFEDRLDELVSVMEESGALVVLSGVGDLGSIPRLYPPLRNLMTRRSARFNQAHHRVAARHGAHVVPHREDDPKLWYRDRTMWSPDLFHVSAAGHERWADATWRVLDPLVNGRDGAG